MGANRTITIVFGKQSSYDFHNVTDRGKMYELMLAQWKKIKYVWWWPVHLGVQEIAHARVTTAQWASSGAF